MIYAFNFRKVITRELPRRKRLPKRIAWIYALCYPIKLMHDEFVALVESYKNEIKWRPQTITIQRALQLKFGEGIVIENQNAGNWVSIGYPAADSRNLIGLPTPQFNNPVGLVAGTGSFASAGFIVKIPLSIVFDQNQLRATVNLYLQQSSYIIQII